MKKYSHIIKTLVLVPFISSVLTTGLVAAERDGGSNMPGPLYKMDTGNFDGNRIYDDLENNGMIVSHRISGHSGMEWPKDSHLYINFASGIWVAGKVGGDIRTAVGEYGPEFVSGPWGGDANSPDHKLYKVNKSDLADPLANSDFQNWPADLGAPWVDNDGDGVYTPMPAGEDHPEFIGDQVIWWVMNDGDLAQHSIFGTLPVGIEMQVTVWGYDRPDAFGDMMFVKALIINKGGIDVTETIIGLWSDPDLGYAGDDFVGCDTTLGLGYCYNDGADADYGADAPAIGYDFFQGPIVESVGDTAFAFGREIPGYKNLGMSSFTKYINGDPVYADPSDAIEAYNYMSGYLRDGTPFLNSAHQWNNRGPDNLVGTPDDLVSGDENYIDPASMFVHPDDPNDNTGPTDNIWVDSDDNASGDRRFLMNAGPFTLADGDSQEVVFGMLIARGADHLSSITALKQADQLAQLAYDIQFALPPSPISPTVVATELKSEIILNWDDGLNAVESYVAEDVIDKHEGMNTEFTFQGYNVYQVETATGLGMVKRIATYDIVDGITEIYDDVFDPALGETINKRVQFGSDSGIQRLIAIDSDALNAGSPLKTNRAYYFAVTAYGYNQYGIPKTLESSRTIMTVRPQVPTTWTEGDNTASSGSTIAATHSVGGSDGTIVVNVLDPTKLTGDDYELYFDIGHYYKDLDGLWKAAASENSIGKTLDCSGVCSESGACADTTLNATDADSCTAGGSIWTAFTTQETCEAGDAVWSASNITASALVGDVGYINLVFTFDMICGDNWVDGITLDLPDGLVVSSWDPIPGCSYGDSYGQNCENTAGTLDAVTNTMFWGDSSRSTFGQIETGGVWNVTISSASVTFPFDVAWHVYDDGYDGTIVDATGNATLAELGYEFKSFQQWNVLNTTTGTLVTADQTMVSGILYENVVNGALVSGTAAFGEDANPIFDGLQVFVNGPTNGIHGIWQTANGNGPIAGVDSDVNENIHWINFLTAPDYPTQQAQGGWVFVTHGGGTANDMDSFYARVFRGSNFSRSIPNDFEMRFTADALANGMGYRRFNDSVLMGNVPFELWALGPDPDDTSDDYRMLPAILNGIGLGAAEDNLDAFDLWGDDESSSAGNDPSSDWVYWGNPDDLSPGSSGYDAWIAPGIGNVPAGGWTEVFARTRIMNWNRYLGGGDIFDAGGALDSAAAEMAMPEVGTILRWITNKPNTIADRFAFSTTSLDGVTQTYNPTTINVWPNPYFAYNPEERNPLQRIVTFTHLPETGSATIRIFNLAGQLVKKIDHSDGTQYEVWDLTNNFNIPVASGMYIAHIETGSGDQILKIAVVQPEERLDVY